MKDLYEILGVSKNASKEEITKAYLNLSRKHHPERGGDEEKYKQINNAYSVLKNSDSRRKYDAHGSEYNQYANNSDYGFFNQSGQGENFFTGFGHSMESNFFFDNKVSLDIYENVLFSIEDIFFNIQKDITFKQNVVCKTCNGIGGFNLTKCKKCNGEGSVKKTFFIIETKVQCNQCNGTGSTYEVKCHDCLGKKILLKETTLRISPNQIISSLRNNKTSGIFTLNGYGHNDSNKNSGDLILKFEIKENKNFSFIKIKGNFCISCNYKLDLFQALIGTKGSVKLGSKKYDFNIKSCTKDGEFIIVNHNKISGMILGCNIVYVYPILNDAQIEELKKIKNY